MAYSCEFIIRFHGNNRPLKHADSNNYFLVTAVQLWWLVIKLLFFDSDWRFWWKRKVKLCLCKAQNPTCSKRLTTSWHNLLQASCSSWKHCLSWCLFISREMYSCSLVWLVFLLCTSQGRFFKLSFNSLPLIGLISGVKVWIRMVEVSLQYTFAHSCSVLKISIIRCT